MCAVIVNARKRRTHGRMMDSSGFIHTCQSWWHAFLKRFIFYLMCICECLHIYTYCFCPPRPKVGMGCPGTRVTGYERVEWDMSPQNRGQRRCSLASDWRQALALGLNGSCHFHLLYVCSWRSVLSASCSCCLPLAAMHSYTSGFLSLNKPFLL